MVEFINDIPKIQLQHMYQIEFTLRRQKFLKVYKQLTCPEVNKVTPLYHHHHLTLYVEKLLNKLYKLGYLRTFSS